MENANIGLGIYEVILLAVVMAAVAWSLVWKGIALWYAARNGHKGWFVALLLIHTLGILEIIYLVSFQKKALPVTGMPDPLAPR